MNSKGSLAIFFAGLLFLACGPAAFGQNSGSMTGTVRDSTGAIIPNVAVEVTNVGTGIATKTTTNSDGDYLVAGLPAGVYNLSIATQGFKKYEATNFTLRVGQKARIDASLVVGDVSTEVAVEGSSVAQVETQSSELSGVVTGKEISQLVLNGRNFTQLVTLVPGVSNQTGQDEGTVGVYGSVAMSINGGRTEYNNWEIDGGDTMDNGSNGTLNVYPNVDAIAEVKVLTSNYGAQYGRNSSGTIETVTKSGTKEFHGDAFEFLRNDDFNARNFFDAQRNEYKKHDFGYTIGGPVYIPGLYNRNKEKTFFFFSEEWRKEIVPGATYQTAVPSSAERQGNFSDVCPGSDCPVNKTTGQPYPNNQVPVDPNAAVIVNALIPASNGGSGAQSFFNGAFIQPTNWREELFRVDENFSDRLRMFVRFIHDSWSTTTPGALWGNGTSFPSTSTKFVGPGVSMVANLTANVSPTLLNEFVFSYTTDHIFLNILGNVQRPSSMTMTGLFNNGFGGLVPSFGVSENSGLYGGGFSGDSGYFPWNNANPTFTFKDNLTKIVGNHNLYMGVYYAAAQKNEDNSPYVQGILNFDNTAAAVTSGNAFADLLLGNISSYSQTNSQVKYYNRYKIVEPYLQDDWHLTPKLTLNLGLRISMFGTYRDRYQHAYNFDPAVYTLASAPTVDIDGSITGQSGAIVPGSGNLFDGLVQCGANGVPAGCMKGHLFNPAPRVGFAWDPFGNGKTAIRGGYGIFFEHTNGNEGNTESLEGSAPLVQTQTQYNIVGYANIGGSGGISFPLGVNSVPRKAIWPYVQQWNFNIQHELSKDTVVTVAYVGSKGTHLSLQRDINQLLPLPLSQNPYAAGQPISSNDCSTGIVNGQAVTGQALVHLNIACGNNGPDGFRAYQGFGTITSLEPQADSIYNALQVSAHRHVGRLSFDLAYTWSHSLDNSSDRYDGNFVNSYNLGYTRASSNFDQRHLLNIGYVYDLPFFTQAGLMHSLLGGWQISGITTFQTGTPFSLSDGVYGDNAGVGNGTGTGSYLVQVGDPNAKPAANQYTCTSLACGPLLFSPSAFAAPQGLTFGGGRNVLNNPSRTNFDMGLFKRFAIKENMGIEFRAEAYNIFNHTQWNGVNSGAACFGSSGSAGDAGCFTGDNASNGFLHPSGAHNPRILQLGMKFLF